jgi:hypothetical protein
MASQGLVTVRVNGQVAMKIVAGCDGYHAKKLAKMVGDAWPITPYEAYCFAAKVGFGERDCRVVIDKETHYSGDDEELPARYRETFDQPEFNPRWKHGTADYVEVVDLEE